jgi:hypothetical protein
MMIVMVGLDFWTLVSYQSHSFQSSLCFGGVEKKKWSYEKEKKKPNVTVLMVLFSRY